MAAFEYTAIDARGRHKKGIEEGDSTRQVRQTLRDKWAGTDLRRSRGRHASNGESRGSSGPGCSSARLRRTMAPLELALFTRQLATLVAAGLPVEESLHTIARQSDKRRVSALVMNVRAQVLEGHSLAAALNGYTQARSAPMYRSTVAAGEQSGIPACGARQSGRSHRAALRVGTQRADGAVLSRFCFLSFRSGSSPGLMIYVVPKIVGVFERTGNELPFLTNVPHRNQRLSARQLVDHRDPRSPPAWCYWCGGS